MKKNLALFIFLAGIVLTAFTSKKHVDTFKVDPKQSNLQWFAEKVGGKHNGTVDISSGELRNDHGRWSGQVVADMRSIKNSDIDKADMKAKLEGHLKSADFFDVEKHPEAKFVINSITPLPKPNEDGTTHQVKGNLTIKEKTNEISFFANIKMEASKITCTGSAVVDRSKYDVRYGSKTFFPNIGDNMIMDEFTLKFNLIALK